MRSEPAVIRIDDRSRAFELRGSIWMTVNGANFGGAGRIELLARIAVFGSIAQAARAMSMSYKAAWDAIDAMNQLAGEPLLERLAGGKGGGGTKLTRRGEQLVANFRVIEREHRRFVDELSSRSCAMADDLSLIGRIDSAPNGAIPFAGINAQPNSEAILAMPIPTATRGRVGSGNDNHRSTHAKGGSELLFVNACTPADCISIWEKHLPGYWREKVARPIQIKRYREYEINAERCVGYDAANQICFTAWFHEHPANPADTKVTNAYPQSRSEGATWRLADYRWLVYQVDCINTSAPQGKYAFHSEMPA